MATIIIVIFIHIRILLRILLRLPVARILESSKAELVLENFDQILTFSS